MSTIASTPIPAFLAYPSRPPLIGDALERFREEVNTAGEVKVTSWKELSGGGRLIIDAITREIDRSDLVIADLTGLNFNVLFEVGYAIAKNKRLWFTLQEARARAVDAMDRFSVLSSYGQCRYSNSRQLVDAFYAARPIASLEQTILAESIVPRLGPARDDHVLYCKLPQNDESCLRIEDRLRRKVVPFLTFDPAESPGESLEVFAPKLFNAKGVIVHVPSEGHHSAEGERAQHAIFAGFAHGLGKDLLILREAGGPSALDYRNIAKSYESASQASSIVDGWLTPIESAWVATEARRRVAQRRVDRTAILERFIPAEFVAENEEDVLGHYFVDTAAYKSALKGQTAVFVGRKGTGKTANLIRISQELAASGEALPVVIKPPSFEMQAVVRRLSDSLTLDKHGYVLESLWKVLLVAEIAKVVESALLQSPGHQSQATRLTEILDRDNRALREDFAVRLERLVRKIDVHLVSPTPSSHDEGFQRGISEVMHSTIIRELRLAIGDVWQDGRRLAILVDNLDKAWDKAPDLDSVSQSLLALIGVPDRIVKDFARDDSRRRPIKISLALFLRSDIFQRVRANAQEPDKIVVHELRWNDPEMLLRVLENRVRFFGGDQFLDPSDAWTKLLPPQVEGMPIKRWLIGQIVQRPRDLIYLFNNAVLVAINRGAPRIHEDHLLEARKAYSRWACTALQVENGIAANTLNDVMVEFLGVPAILSKEDVLIRIRRVVPDSNVETAFVHLCKLGFLGLETSRDRFEWALDPSDLGDLISRSSRFAGGGSVKVSVARAYRNFLEIVE